MPWRDKTRVREEPVDATDSTRLCQPNHYDNEMHQKDQEPAHSGNRTKIRKSLILAAFNPFQKCPALTLSLHNL